MSDLSSIAQRSRCEWVDQPAGVDENSAAIVELMNASSDDDGILGYPDPLTPEQARGFIETLRFAVATGAVQLMLYRIDDAVRGMVQLNVSHAPNSLHIANLSKGVMHPEARGLAAMRVAFAAIVERARELAIEVLTLDVRQGSKACLIWHHYGFTTYGILPDYIRYAGKSHDGDYMSQRVDNLAAFLRSQEGH
ncbi:MAG: hypothetical protein M3O36_10095 [Myxococcota bacterium]|nr:hypothetical protein [Myxococcota bacterium]